jgi:hypothetical protein
MLKFALFLILTGAMFFFTYSYFNKKNGDNDWDILTLEGKSCDMEGSTNNTQTQYRNRLKNRWHIPRNEDFDTAFTWQNIMGDEENPRRFDTKKAGILRGYIAYISRTNAESCNCNYREEAFHDLHIALVENEADLRDRTKHIIIEITPRLREIMKAQNIDWHFDTLKKWRRKKVTVEGWLFYDWDHGDDAFLRMRDSVNNWRATCWEIHPVTKMTVE